MAVPTGEESILVSALEVLEGDEVMIVTEGGQVQRFVVDDVPAQGRRTQGRRLIKLDGGDRVVEVTRAYGEAGARREPAAEDLPGQLDLLGAGTPDTD